MRIWMLPGTFAVLFALGCGQQTAGQTSSQPSSTPTAAAAEEAASAEGKKVVMIIAHRNFRDEELLRPRSVLEKAGAKVTIACSSLTPAKGMLGATVKPDLLLKDVKPEDYHAVLYVGGPGAKEYWDDKKAHEVARQALDKGKVLGAICIAPVTLANAGLLDGKKATVWPSEAGRLRAQGANYTGSDVEVDGRIITASGPEAAEKFGRAVLKALGG
jgi:protease I